MIPQNFAVLTKLGFCLKCSQNISGYSFARARIFLQVLTCSVFSGGSFLESARCSLGLLLSLLVHAVIVCSQRPKNFFSIFDLKYCK